MFWKWLKSLFVSNDTPQNSSNEKEVVINHQEVLETNTSSDSDIEEDTTGDIIPSSDGNFDIDIGGGMTIDPSDGSIGINIGGFGIDLFD